MKWWNDLWLNEGFATFVQYKAVAEVHKDWELVRLYYFVRVETGKYKCICLG